MSKNSTSNLLKCLPNRQLPTQLGTLLHSLSFPEPLLQLGEISYFHFQGLELLNPWAYLLAVTRECEFQAAAEGTGGFFDFDSFDSHYEHIIAWDFSSGSLAGALRFARGSEILKDFGIEGFYTSTLFDLNPRKVQLARAIEVGRLFVARSHRSNGVFKGLWKALKRSQRALPPLDFLTGSVTLSNKYSSGEKAAISLHYLQLFSPPDEARVQSRSRPFSQPTRLPERMPGIFEIYLKLFGAENLSFDDVCEDPNFSHCWDLYCFIRISSHRGFWANL